MNSWGQRSRGPLGSQVRRWGRVGGRQQGGQAGGGRSKVGEGQHIWWLRSGNERRFRMCLRGWEGREETGRALRLGPQQSPLF